MRLGTKQRHLVHELSERDVCVWSHVINGSNQGGLVESFGWWGGGLGVVGGGASVRCGGQIRQKPFQRCAKEVV